MKERRVDIIYALGKIQNEMKNVKGRLKWIDRNYEKPPELMGFFIKGLQESCEITSKLVGKIITEISGVQYRKEEDLDAALKKILKLAKDKYELFVETPTEYWGESQRDCMAVFA